jgi:hypothetical protein
MTQRLPGSPVRFPSTAAQSKTRKSRQARGLAHGGMLLVALALVTPGAAAQTSTPKPPPQTPPKRCLQSPQYRQLDFWVGEWAVTTRQGHHVGESSVHLILDKCVVFENWTGDRGLAGKSFNIYNRKTGKWEQIWVSSVGNLTKYAGGFKDGAMRYMADETDEQGKPILLRLTFFPVSADEVRQLGESSADGGKTWKTQYDLYYHRKK